MRRAPGTALLLQSEGPSTDGPSPSLTGPLKQLAFITVDRSDYDPRLKQLLDDTGIDPQEFESLDYFSLIPVFLLAGASVRTAAQAHGDHMHLEGWYVEVEDDLEPIFFTELPRLLEQMAD